MERILQWAVSDEDAGRRIRDVLRSRLGLSRALVTSLKTRENGIELNHRPAFANAMVRQGDLITVTLEDSGSKNVFPTPGKLDVVYEDEDLLIVDKPPNLPVHPSKGHVCDTLANIVAWYYRSKGQSFTFRCVNRLDAGTSGLMAIAKNAHAHARLAALLKEGLLRREYLAVACGRLESDEGTIDLPIGRRPGVATIRREVMEGGDRAVTHYRVIACSPRFTLLQLRLETGRTHQIRVHLAHLGHPLAGDFLYGVEDRSLITRHALHSAKLSLIGPVTGRPLCFSSPLPEDMARLMEL